VDARDSSNGLRIGDAEREQALTALGEHFTAGRLDVQEYSDRSAQVTEAKTRADVLALFQDLPQPHPAFSPATGDAPLVPARRPAHPQYALLLLLPLLLLAGVSVALLHTPGPLFVLLFLGPALLSRLGHHPGRP
jgi:hypothetical protein